jgi:hypothetical protein
MHVTPNHSSMLVEQYGERLVQIGAMVDLQWGLQ